MSTTISIMQDGVAATDGRIVGGQVVDAAGSFGDADETEAVYEAIEDAIYRGDDQVEVAGHTYTWDIEAPPVHRILWGHSGTRGREWTTAREASRYAAEVWGETEAEDAEAAARVAAEDVGSELLDWYADGLDVHIVLADPA